MNLRTTRPLCTAALAAALWCAPPLAAQESVVGVLSRDTLPYRDAEAAMREALVKSSIAVRSTVLGPSGVLAPGLMPHPRATAVTFGQRAGMLLAAANHASQVSCMTLDPIGRASVVLPHPAEARLERVRRVFPRGKTMGFLVAQDSVADALAAEFQRAARRFGLEILAHPVDLKRPLAPQLEGLGDRIDVLLATYDVRIFSAENAQPILLFSYRHRIPVIGVSDAWSRAGALMSFDWDYPDIGRQCGELAAKLVAGGAPDKPVVEVPRRLVYSLNLEAARYFLIKLPPEVVEGARHKFN